MNLNDALKLVADARAANPQTDVLYQAVDARSTITIDVSPEETWGSETTALGTTIRSEEHTSELQSLMRISYAVFCLKKKTNITKTRHHTHKTAHNHNNECKQPLNINAS